MVWEMSVEFQGHHPLLWRSSQHWRDEYPTPQPDIHCKAQCLQTLSVMCFVMAMMAMLFSF